MIPFRQGGGGNNPNLQQQAMQFNPNFSNSVNPQVANVHGNNNFHATLNPMAHNNNNNNNNNNQLGVHPQVAHLLALQQLQNNNPQQFQCQVNLLNQITPLLNQLAQGNQMMQMNQLMQGNQLMHGNQMMLGNQLLQGGQMMQSNPMMQGTQLIPNHLMQQGNQKMGMMSNCTNTGLLGNSHLPQNNLNPSFGNGALSVGNMQGKKPGVSSMGQSGMSVNLSAPMQGSQSMGLVANAPNSGSVCSPNLAQKNNLNPSFGNGQVSVGTMQGEKQGISSIGQSVTNQNSSASMPMPMQGNQIMGLMVNPPNPGLMGNSQNPGLMGNSPNLGLMGNSPNPGLMANSPHLGLMTSPLNLGFMGNPQLTQNNLDLSFRNAAMQGPRPMGQSGTSVNSSMPMQTCWNGNNMQQVQQTQVNHVELGRNNNSSAIPQNSPTKGFTRNFHGFGRGETSHKRFQKAEFHDTRNAKGMRPFNKSRGRGQRSQRDRPMKNADCSDPAVQRRPFPINYTENEIQQWLGARKKNFPTAANINKKVAGGEKNDVDIDVDAKLRRQELKEILAKQAELGVEVAEIPPSYLGEPENQDLEKENKKNVTYVNGRNKFNNKRGRHGCNNRHAKKQKSKDEAATATSPIVTREPSLLHKLLSSDIKRDNSKLLQVFRFMVLNDFFKQWPHKPLDFPVVTVKEGESQVGGEKNPSLTALDSVIASVVQNVIVDKIDSQNSVADEVANAFNEEDVDDISYDEVAKRPTEKEDAIGEKLKD